MDDKDQKGKVNTEAQKEEAVWKNMNYRRLLSSMSHDLRTPLNTVIGLTELAQTKSGDKEYVDYCLEKIDASAHFLLNMVNDLLAITNLEERDIALNREPVNVQEVFQSVADNAREMAFEKRINLAAAKDEHAITHVLTDSIRFHRVLQNLINNAVKYTPRFGRIDFIMEQLSATKEKVKYCFTIKDTGVGIAEDVQEQLFQPFVQEYTGSTTVYGGIGLGLAICKRIVDAMGGEIEFHSVKGEGTEFKVTLELDIDQKAQEADEDQEEIQYNFAGKHVLLAEDNEINCEIAKMMLTRKGLEVETAENGQMALSKFMMNAPGTFDLILMDVRMPYMDGLTATRRIRASGKSDATSIPIIALTANAYDEDVQKSMAAGMNAHLVKPVDPKELFKHIQKALDGKL